MANLDIPAKAPTSTATLPRLVRPRSGPALRKRHLLPALLLSTTSALNVTLSLNLNQTHQTVDGFGFCEAFQRANALKNLPAPQQRQVLDALFNTTTGAGLSIVRVGLGSSPNSTDDHMNSIAPAPPAGRTAGSAPAYSWDRNDSNQVWVAQRAVEYGVDMFYADAWSAPGYMKTNGRDDQGGYLCGVKGAECESGNWVAAYAEYLVQYVKYYLSEGVPIKYLGFVNEPNLVKPYATMLSDGYQAAEVIKPLHASLAAANLSSIGITCCEGQGWSMQRNLTLQLQAAGAENYTSLTTTHAYKGDPAAPDGPLNTTLKVWITENSPIILRLGMTGLWYKNGSENEGLNWANLLHDAFTTGNVTGYIYWIGAGHSSREVPLMWIPRRNESTPAETPWFEMSAPYWAFAHFSRFIRPGAVRVGLSPSTEALKVTAYQNKDRSVVVEAINNGNESVSLTLNDVPKPNPWQLSRMTTWLTDNTHNMTLMGTTQPYGVVREEIPARSLVTFFIKHEQLLRFSTSPVEDPTNGLS